MKNSAFIIPYTIIFILLISSFASCKKDDSLSLSATSKTLTRGQTFNLGVSPSSDGCTFETGNELIATVTQSGLVTAELVGETNITVINTAKGLSAQCKIIVAPEYEMYREPYLVFDKPKKDIKSYEERYLYSEDDTSLLYIGENSYISGVIYMFENSSYSISSCLIPAISETLFDNFISERYYHLYTENDFITLMTPDGKTLVGIQKGLEINSLIYDVVYYIAFPEAKSNNLFREVPDWNKFNHL